MGHMDSGDDLLQFGNQSNIDVYGQNEEGFSTADIQKQIKKTMQ
jgi:hypothetical protein